MKESNKFRGLAKLALIIKNKLMFNALIRSFIQGFLMYYLAALLSTKTMKWDNFTSVLDSILAIVYLIFLTIFPIFIIKFLKR